MERTKISKITLEHALAMTRQALPEEPEHAEATSSYHRIPADYGVTLMTKVTMVKSKNAVLFFDDIILIEDAEGNEVSTVPKEVFLAVHMLGYDCGRFSEAIDTLVDNVYQVGYDAGASYYDGIIEDFGNETNTLH